MKQTPKTQNFRGRGGFKRASGLMEKPIRAASEKRGFAVSRLLTHWIEIVGSDIAKMARPVDVKYGRDGFGATLTVLTTGANAPMLEMQKEKLRERVNACYGYNAISRIRLTQTAPIGFSEGQAKFVTAPPKKPEKSREIKKITKDTVSPIDDDGLRAALTALGENVLSRSHHRPKDHL